VIVALTANVMLGEEARCLEACMDGYLSKPVRLDTLTSTLQRLAPRTRK
jgi:CheY-like chemotaxis protein